MKKCKKCGAVHGDDSSVCVDCGTFLGDSVSEADEQAAEAALDGALHSMTERTEDFYIPPLQRVFGWLCVLGVIAAIVLLALAGGAPEESRAGTAGLIAAILLIAAAPMLLVPRVLWFLLTLKYRLFYEWDTTPSYFALAVGKGLAYAFAVGGMIALIVGYTACL